MITIRSKVALKATMGLTLFFVVLNLVVYFLQRVDIISEKYLRLVDLDSERNLPTFYSTLLLLTTSLTLLSIGLNDKRKYYWYLLSAIFCFLALDENISIHEELINITKSFLGDTHGFLYFAWIIPYGIAAILLAAFYFRFVWTLPKKTRLLFFISGAVFLMGALGMEMVSGCYGEEAGFSSPVYKCLTFLEETLEMVGVSLFIFALLDYIEANLGRLVILMQK